MDFMKFKNIPGIILKFEQLNSHEISAKLIEIL